MVMLHSCHGLATIRKVFLEAFTFYTSYTDEHHRIPLQIGLDQVAEGDLPCLWQTEALAAIC